jgi:hypothetical protein
MIMGSPVRNVRRKARQVNAPYQPKAESPVRKRLFTNQKPEITPQRVYERKYPMTLFFVPQAPADEGLDLNLVKPDFSILKEVRKDEEDLFIESVADSMSQKLTVSSPKKEASAVQPNDDIDGRISKLTLKH